MFVKKCGFKEVEKTYSAENALELVQSFRPELMLVDINLHSDISGVDVVKKAQEESDVQAIYITGNSDNLHKEIAAETNYISYLVKPIDFSSLKELLIEEEILPE